MTHSSLWADLGAILMDGVADLSSGSEGLVIKPGQIVATAIQIDSVEVMLESEPDDDESMAHMHNPPPFLHVLQYCYNCSNLMFMPTMLTWT